MADSPSSPGDARDTVASWLAAVEAAYPPGDAADWDEVGLHVGAPEDEVTGVVVALDVTEAVIDEAVDQGANMVVAHHPLLFRPLSRLTPATAAGRLALHAARRGCAVIAAHTNVDVAVAGTSDPVVDLLGLRNVAPLRPVGGAQQQDSVKLVTFVPREVTSEVIGALAAAGAGQIGEYASCSFRVAGTGTFRPSERAAPVVGERERLNEVAEDRLEMVVEHPRVAAVVAALERSHPYEEVAYDLVPLAPPPAQGSGAKGLGRIGNLPEPRALADLARAVATDLPSPQLRLAGDPDQQVTRVAVCGGAGDGLIDAAFAAGAELYITGDLRHHPTLDARTRGLALIDAGHYWTEVAALPAVRARLGAEATRHGLQARLIPSRITTDPWTPADRWR